MSNWILADDKPISSSFYYFKKEFNAKAGAALVADICGDSRYNLYLNGKLVSEGPCQGPIESTYYESEDLTPYLIEGKNTLCAKVLYLTPGIFNIINRKDRPAFWFNGKFTENGEVKDLSTDQSWMCFKETACELIRGPFVHPAMNPFEVWSGDSTPVQIPVIQSYSANLEMNSINPWGIAEPYKLVPRIIPQMYHSDSQTFSLTRSGDDYLEFDSGEYTTSKFNLKFIAPKGSKIKIIYAECYSQRDENGKKFKSKRDDHLIAGTELVGVYDIITATGEIQEFTPFWYRSFRFIRLEFDNKAKTEIISISHQGYFYPMVEEGKFNCSESRLNNIWHISKNTLRCCTHEKFVDCPYYEQSQYQMDSGLEMLYFLRLSSDRRIARKSLFDLASSQIFDGMLQANYPSLEEQVIPGFTLYWVLMLRDYMLYCNDDNGEVLKDVYSLIGTMTKALESFNSYMTADGLIGPTPYWPFLDWVPTWRGGVPNGGRTAPITAYSLLYATALKAASEICSELGIRGFADEYIKRADKVIKAVNSICYDTQTGLYKDTPVTNEYSQHTTLWAVLSGAVSDDEAGKLVDRTFNAEVPVSVCTFSMNYYMFRALEKARRYDKYAKTQLEGWQRMLDLNCTTWCENPDSPRSECHGWSSAPIYEFSAMVLGVKPLGNGYTKISIKPNISAFNLTFAEGSVPTPHGTIQVKWEICDDKFIMKVTLPSLIYTEVVIPDGTKHVQTQTEAIYTCIIT